MAEKEKKASEEKAPKDKRTWWGFVGMILRYSLAMFVGFCLAFVLIWAQNLAHDAAEKNTPPPGAEQVEETATDTSADAPKDEHGTCAYWRDQLVKHPKSSQEHTLAQGQLANYKCSK